MAKLIIESNNSFNTEITVRESDEYTEAVFLKFERNYIPEKRSGVNEMFMTPDELDRIGRFFLRQADEISKLQAHRHLTERIRKNPTQG